MADASTKQHRTIIPSGLRSPIGTRSKLTTERIFNLQIFADNLVRALNTVIAAIKKGGAEKATVSLVPIAGQTIVFATIGIDDQPTASYPALAIADSGGYVAISSKTTTGFTIKPYFDNETVHIVVF